MLARYLRKIDQPIRYALTPDDLPEGRDHLINHALSQFLLGQFYSRGMQRFFPPPNVRGNTQEAMTGLGLYGLHQNQPDMLHTLLGSHTQGNQLPPELAELQRELARRQGLGTHPIPQLPEMFDPTGPLSHPAISAYLPTGEAARDANLRSVLNLREIPLLHDRAVPRHLLEQFPEILARLGSVRGAHAAQAAGTHAVQGGHLNALLTLLDLHHRHEEEAKRRGSPKVQHRMRDIGRGLTEALQQNVGAREEHVREGESLIHRVLGPQGENYRGFHTF